MEVILALVTEDELAHVVLVRRVTVAPNDDEERVEFQFHGRDFVNFGDVPIPSRSSACGVSAKVNDGTVTNGDFFVLWV